MIDAMEFWVKRLSPFKHCDWMGECSIYRSTCEMSLLLSPPAKVMDIPWNVSSSGGGRCRDVLTPGASEASPTHTGPTFRVTESLVITVTEKLTVWTILSLLAHVCAIGPLQSDRAEALPCHMITVGGATLTLLSTLRSIEPS